MELPNQIDSEVLMEFVEVFNHEYAGKEWSVANFRNALSNWMKPEWRKVPDFTDAYCKGSIALGTSCMKCPKCKKELSKGIVKKLAEK